MLFGDRIRLRGIERTDIPIFVRWFNDPEVRQGLLLFAPMSQAEEERWFEARLTRGDDYLFGIEAPVEEGHWQLIGNVDLHQVDWRARACVFGIAIGEKSSWGQGYGTDATRTILRFAFSELNLHRVELEVMAFNARALRVYQKVGFKHEGTRRDRIFHEGRYHDAHIMSLLREEFAG
jgi:diamine N-acetyltransferase